MTAPRRIRAVPANICSSDQDRSSPNSYNRVVLTIYEQIQQAVDLIEKDVSAEVTAKEAARTAGMSLRSFHQYFPALTGYRFGEYQRRRRLAVAADALRSVEAPVLAIAVDSGYDSHEAFTRAFKTEFGVTPTEFRSGAMPAARVRAIDLVGEVNMGVLTKSLPEMKVAVFDGYRPDPEWTALGKMENWLERHGAAIGPHRVFGHNIDEEGRLALEADNVGYRVMVTVPETALPFDDDTQLATIAAGTFVVTGIEGSFEEDPTGSWITAGWRRLTEMVKRNELQVHPSGRWFEEHLEPVQSGNNRFDLYLELE
jgi:AraC-like DNA-binding protein